MLNYKDVNPYQRPSLGTTILGYKFKNGIIMAADTQTAHGSLISDESFNKIKQLTDTIFMAVAGDASHADASVDYIRYYLNMYIAEVKEQPTVEAAAKTVREFFYNNKSFLNVTAIVGGYDKVNGFGMYKIFQSGALINEKLSMGGSGCTFISALIDEKYKDDMELEEAKAFGVGCVKAAMRRDVQSGGCVNLVIVTEEKVEREFIKANAF